MGSSLILIWCVDLTHKISFDVHCIDTTGPMCDGVCLSVTYMNAYTYMDTYNGLSVSGLLLWYLHVDSLV